MNGDTFTIISDLRGRIAELEAEAVGLRQSLALDEISMRANGVGQWTPIEAVAEFCFCEDECAAILMLRDSCIIEIQDALGETQSFTLPDQWRLCRENTGDYITVHRGYLENLEAKANALK